MFRKTKLSSAVAIALAATVSATMLTGLTGCKVTEGGTSITSGSTTQITNPKGTVVGIVQDTNGAPLAGVTVSVAGLTTTTDSSGSYRFNNVGVINAAGADGATGHAALNVVVSAPTGYLGSTVSVSPNAQFDAGDGANVRENTATVFVDGFLASTGIAVLPELSASVIGVLRNTNTGEPIVGATVSLDMTGIAAEGAQIVNGDVTFHVAPFTAVTGADGSYSFANLPADSTFRMDAMIDANTSVTWAAAQATPATADEATVTDLGNLFALPITHLDIIPPYVTSVVGVQDQTVTPGVFNDDLDGTATTNGIVINFSEPLIVAEVDGNSAVPYVYDTMGGANMTGAYVDVVSADMAADGMSMTVITSTALPAGHVIEINLLRADFQDVASNIITAGGATEVGFAAHDLANSMATAMYQLTLQVFDSINTDASAVTLTQMTADTSGTDDDGAIQTSNASFADVEDNENNGFQQLDSSDNDAGPDIDAEERKDAVVTALTGVGVESDVARVTFTPVNATRYVLQVLNEDGTANNAATMAMDSVADGTVNLADAVAVDSLFELEDMNGSVAAIELIVGNVAPGSMIRTTPFDDLGNPGSSTTVSLVDNVPPTTSLQRGYVHGGDDTSSSVTSVTFGDGAENANIGSSLIGVPVWPVTASILDNMIYNGATPELVSVQGNSDQNLTAELMENNTVDNTVGGSGVQYIAPVAAGPYDATAYLAFDLSRTAGIGMTEDGTVTGTPVFSGTNATITNYVESNDVQANDEAGVVNVDLINMDIDDIVALAADTGATIDLAGAVTDTAGNVSATGAAVAIRDDLPPMIKSAVYTGRTIVVTFNEPIVINTATDVLTLTGFGDLGLTNSTLDTTTDPANTVLTISPEITAAPVGTWHDANDTATSDGFDNTLNRTAVFTAPQYSEAASVTYTVQSATDAEAHGVLSAEDINDASENDWGNDAGEITDYPTFAIIDATGDFVLTTSPTPPAALAVTATLTYVFAHPFDVRASLDVCAGAGNIVEASGSFSITGGTAGVDGVANCFTSDSGVTTSTGASYVGATNTLTVNLGFPALASADDITWDGSAAQSEYDSTDTIPAVTLNVTTP